MGLLNLHVLLLLLLMGLLCFRCLELGLLCFRCLELNLDVGCVDDLNVMGFG